MTQSAGNLVDETVRLTRQAAELGLRSAWLGQRMDFDSVALAGIAGREVPGIAVGTSAVPIFARHPILVSSQAQRAGRGAPRIAALVPGLVTTDLDTAREAAAAATAFYDQVPSYQRMTELAGASRTSELVTFGDEQAVATVVQDYFDAGATEVIFTETNLLGEEARLRTWRLLGELARG
ncbi:LLM class flavin-dependent oxidoreductase [Actinospica durhamensis]|uniref:LLM class flavin-dependent oxidoreductase n=1 Tax=Actinospica durhamensis TaxID=1508375 RepID=A0A941EKA5_9ACTN|nr:LLM class flavin-dependent oxidoreductase [Actinospica durhamensis]MBR7833147.1 LLM class flavin-dependent oxidoreductase [Actinospica durhamensis]